MKTYKISNQFPGGLFQCVTILSLYDERPFEREFFTRISKSFPMIKELRIENNEPQQKKTYNDKDMTVINYPHLELLDLLDAHVDYLELFLLDTEICLSNNVDLLISFEPLKLATNNFQRDETRVNCGKLMCFIEKSVFEFPEHAKNYFAGIWWPREC